MAKSEVYNTDCIEYMRTLPDNHFDIAVCDPPYGHGNDESLLGGGAEVRTAIPEVFPRTGSIGGGIREIPQNASGDGSRDTSHLSRWNRLKGGRRERYYTPPTPIHRGGGVNQRPLHGMLHRLRSSSTSYSASAEIR